MTVYFFHLDIHIRNISKKFYLSASNHGIFYTFISSPKYNLTVASFLSQAGQWPIFPDIFELWHDYSNFVEIPPNEISRRNFWPNKNTKKPEVWPKVNRNRIFRIEKMKFWRLEMATVLWASSKLTLCKSTTANCKLITANYRLITANGAKLAEWNATVECPARY